MSTAIEAALETQARPITGPLRSAIDWPQIRYRKHPTREELVAKSKSKDRYDAINGKFLLDVLDTTGSLPESYPIPVQVVRFGESLTIAAMGGEVVIDYALRLKKEFGEKETAHRSGSQATATMCPPTSPAAACWKRAATKEEVPCDTSDPPCTRHIGNPKSKKSWSEKHTSCLMLLGR